MIPPPTPSTALPMVSNSTVRIATLNSHPAMGDAKPTVPQYIPRRCCSHCEISWRARSLGVPVTEAGGKAASSSADVGSSVANPCRHRGDQVPHARRAPHDQQLRHGDRAGNRHPAKVIADQIDDHDVLGHFFGRSPQRRRPRVQRQGALDRAGRHDVPTAAKEKLRRQRCHRTPFAGDVGRAGRRSACHAGDEEVQRGPADRPGELRAHARLVDLAGADRLQAGKYAVAMGLPVGRVPVDPGNPAAGRPRAGTLVSPASAPASQSGIGAPDRLSYHHCASRSRRSTQSVQPPAASGIRAGRPSAPGSG